VLSALGVPLFSAWFSNVAYQVQPPVWWPAFSYRPHSTPPVRLYGAKLSALKFFHTLGLSAQRKGNLFLGVAAPDSDGAHIGWRPPFRRATDVLRAPSARTLRLTSARFVAVIQRCRVLRMKSRRSSASVGVGAQARVEAAAATQGWCDLELGPGGLSQTHTLSIRTACPSCSSLAPPRPPRHHLSWKNKKKGEASERRSPGR